jgi:cyclic nucleotide-binding protein
VCSTAAARLSRRTLADRCLGSPRRALIATGLIVVVVVALSVPSLTAIDHRISEPGPDLALLRQVSFFGPLPVAIVEHLASELQSATYEPGDVIIQDGHLGERFYMITDGRARVCKDGKELRQMGTGESFGEIALLRQVPRTATVIAISRLQARTLTRDEFSTAVTGNAASAEGADEVISARLQAG